jgi:predicted HTH transcriptional regulator
MSKLRVFVSSVQKELGMERAAVPHVIAVDSFLDMQCEAVLFENEPTSGRPRNKVYLECLKGCAIYLLIVDVEYGRPDGDFSATHHEYREAQRLKMPTAIFIRGLDSAKDRDRKPETIKFLEEIKGDEHKYKRFHDREDLRPAIREALLSILKCQFNRAPTKTEIDESDHQIDKASTFELVSMDDLPVDELDSAAVSELVKVLLEPKFHIFDTASEHALALRGLAIRRNEQFSIANRAACILFHSQPATRFPQCEILADAYDEPRISGRPKGMETINAPLLVAVRQALAFIDKHTFHPHRVVGLNNVRLDEYPAQSLREVLINALAHRDYADASRKIILRVFSDRIEVASPGYPLKPLTISKLEKGNYRPCSRNPLITQTLALMHQMEQRGTGFARMRTAMLNHGLDAPELSQSDGYFVVTFPGPDGDYDRIRVTGKVAGPVTPAIEEQLNDRQKKILIEVQKSGLVTSGWCRNALDITYDTANRDLKALLELGLVERTGAGRSSAYRMKGQNQ